MISPTYFRHKIAITLVMFSVFLSLLFCVLVWLGMEKSDDNAREALLVTHFERLSQYFEETGKLWARDQLSGIDILVKGRDTIPDEIEQLPLGYFEKGEKNIYIYAATLSLPSPAQPSKVYLVHSGQDKEWIEEYEPIIHLLLAIVTLLVILIGAITGLILSRKLSEPLQSLTQQIKATDPNAPNFSSLQRDDEFGEISDAFANTLNRINEALEREKQFSRYASHELRTPVAVINSSVDLWQACKDEADQQKAESIQQRAMERIATASKQMEDVIQTFLLLGKNDIASQEKQLINLSELLDELIEKYRELLGTEHIQINQNITPNHTQLTNHSAVVLVLSNLLRNAFAYSASQIHIELNDKQLTISNDIDDLRLEKADHFGFGLKITQDLCQILNWSFSYDDKQRGQFSICLGFH